MVDVSLTPRRVVAGNDYTTVIDNAGVLHLTGRSRRPPDGVHEHSFRAVGPFGTEEAPAVDVSRGNGDILVVDASGSLWASYGDTPPPHLCWPRTRRNPLPPFTPQLVVRMRRLDGFGADGARAVAVACGDRHQVVLSDDGSVWSAGDGSSGALGDGETMPRAHFARTGGFGEEQPEARLIATGRSHTAVVDAEGDLWLSGYNSVGCLGVASRSLRVTGFARAKALDGGELKVAGVAAHTFYTAVVDVDGELWASGSNPFAAPEPIATAAAFETTGTFMPTGFTAATGRKARAVAGGQDRGLVLDDGGLVWSTGRYTAAWTEYRPAHGPVVAVACGADHDLVLSADGTLYGRGANDSGQLGLGFTGGYAEGFLDLTLPPRDPDVLALGRRLVEGCKHPALGGVQLSLEDILAVVEGAVGNAGGGRPARGESTDVYS